MKKSLTLLAMALGMTAYAATPVKVAGPLSSPEPTVLESVEMAGGHTVQVVRDAKGRVYKRTLRPDASVNHIAIDRSARKAPQRAATERTFYEGFEGYQDGYGLNWIPEGWSKINTEAHTPTEEQLAHNINNSWYVYFSSDFYQQMTTDGLSEAFIHFGYNGNHGATDAAQDEWLVSPEITLGDNETLSFMLQCDYSTVYTWNWNTMKFDDRSVVDNTMKVMITTDGGQNWTCLWDLEADVVRNISDRDCYYTYGDMMYHDFSLSLGDYAGKTVKIAFRYERLAGWVGNSMMVDGVVVEHPKEGSDPWTYLGKGTMADGWVIPNLTKNPGEVYNPQDYVYEVEIYESDETPGVYKLKSPYTSAAFPFIHLNGNTSVAYDIIVDASDPTFVTVAPQISGFEHNDPGSKASRYAVPYYISNAGQYYLDDGNAKADIISYGYASTFDAENGVITIAYPQYGHEKADGSLDMGYSCSGFDEYPTVITLPGKEPEPVWTSLGKATFVDGFLYSGFYGNPKGHGWEVEVQEKDGEPGMYRLVNPYTCDESPLAYFNSNTADAYVIIDATDPNLVSMTPQYSGYTGYTQGELWDFYIGNTVGQYVGNYGLDKADLSQLLEDEFKDTMANGVITFKEPLFGANATTEFGYAWTDDSGTPFFYEAKLYLPSATETPEGPDVLAESITLDLTEAEGTVGETITLTATVSPEETTDKTVTWASSDETVATVADGVVTLLAEGKADITATCGIATATCAVTVKAVAGIDLITVDNAVETVYYTTMGVKVDGVPSSGVYIKVSGGKAVKVKL